MCVPSAACRPCNEPRQWLQSFANTPLLAAYHELGQLQHYVVSPPISNIRRRPTTGLRTRLGKRWSSTILHYQAVHTQITYRYRKQSYLRLIHLSTDLGMRANSSTTLWRD